MLFIFFFFCILFFYGRSHLINSLIKLGFRKYDSNKLPAKDFYPSDRA